MLPEWNETLFGILLDSSLRVTLVAASIAMILLLARVRASNVRHAAWTAVLCAMLLMPVLPYCVPSLSIPAVLPDVEVNRPVEYEAMTSPSAASDAHSASEESAASPIFSPGQAITAGGTALDAMPARDFDWANAGLVLYVAGALILLAHLFLGWLGMRRIARSAVRIDVGERHAPDGGSADLWESRLVATPVTAGLLSPKIVLPGDWRLWQDDKLRAILAHELAHVRRRDPLIGLLARLNRCIFWFHPLAWWLEWKLATTAEHACDDVAVRAVGTRRTYAEVLLDMAEAVRRAGGRFSWQGVGVGGTGFLGRRIDRILCGDAAPPISLKKKALVTVACTAAIFVVAGCRPQAQSPAPLQEAPGMAAERIRTGEEGDIQKKVRELDAEGAADLEAALSRNPDDLVTRRILLQFYAQRGPQLLGGKKAVAARRLHILWLIEHHPDSALIRGSEVQLVAVDAASNQRARTLWLSHTSRPDAGAAVLGNAASFFEGTDPAEAEKLLLRARTQDSGGPWSSRLATLYASVLSRAHSGRPPAAGKPDPLRAYAEEVRKKLEDSKDAQLLAEVGSRLGGRITFIRGSDFAGNFYMGSLQIQRSNIERIISPTGSLQIRMAGDGAGKSYLDRALKLDPQSVRAHSAFVSDRIFERDQRMRQALRDVPRELTSEAVAGLPENERFAFLPQLAERAYLDGERLDYNRRDETGAAISKAAWNLARLYAEDALRLAPKFRQDPDYGTAVFKANIVLGTVALRLGDKRSAVRYMLEASKAPASEELQYWQVPPLTLKLLGYLLKYGERDTVVEFLERFTQTKVADRSSLLAAADQIKKGFRPDWYPKD